MPAFASLLAASALRVASLDLCSDEYLLLLARPQEIASVSRLSQDPAESSLWRRARAFPANRGSVEQVLAMRPTVLLTMGGGARSTRTLATRLGLKVIDLPYPSSVDDVAATMRRVAAALGDAHRADRWLADLRTLQAAPRGSIDAIWVSGGGSSLSAQSPGAQWLGLAGLKQRRLAGGRADLETMLVRPPRVVVRSDYRRGQMSQGMRWFDHPIVRRLAARTVSTDGRPWTCAGPPMLAEIERLKRAVK